MRVSRTGGSSPRMRGARYCTGDMGTMVGIIPAYAGSTLEYRAYWFALRDHPRVCGEHRPVAVHARQQPGSSPRMRGAPAIDRRRRAEGGIIPAYAGSTPPYLGQARGRRDHPRVCGEHSMSPSAHSFSSGSSPRMRGAPHAGFAPVDDLGIIPAYAGSTEGQWCMPDWDSGSSPRMRGARLSLGFVLLGLGIIPAYAGSTRS